VVGEEKSFTILDKPEEMSKTSAGNLLMVRHHGDRATDFLGGP
jgi:hypothetical protein